MANLRKIKRVQTMGNTRRGQYGVGPILRALRLLEMMGEHGHDMRLSEMVAQLGWPKTTVFRYLRNLEISGFVTYDAVRERYAVGPKFRMFAQTSRSLHCLRRCAAPVIERLSSKYSETINLAMPSGLSVVYLDMVEANRPKFMLARIGERQPMCSTALGQAILAFLPDRERAAIVEAPIMEMTHRTITQPSQIRRKLARAAKEGYVVEFGEAEEGLACIGVPVLDENKYPLAAISLSSAERRLKKADIPAIADGLLRASFLISADLRSIMAPQLEKL